MVLERMRESESSGCMDFEYRYHHPQRGLRWLYAKGQLRADARRRRRRPARAAAGKKAYGVVLDITERKKAEEALSLSQQRLMIALAASRTGTYRLDPQTNSFLHLGENLRDLLELAPGRSRRTPARIF